MNSYFCKKFKTHMRILLLAFIILSTLSLNAQKNDDVLFTVDDNEVTVSEFKYIYEKNNADNADYSKESLDEYLGLYKKFKLKVRRAKDIGLDTVKSLQDELAGYRKQLAKSYLKDKEISNKLIEEVAVRMQEDIEVQHIFVAVDLKTSEERLATAEDKINNIYDKLMQNDGKGFEEMAKTLSEDKITAPSGGRLGFYTSPLPDGFYEFENAMYNTNIGDFSKPIRSRMGFHIIRPINKRPARGEMEIAHILIRNKDRGKAGAKVLIDSVYSLLNEGKSFDNLAAKFSVDTKTKHNGGYIGFFGINQYEETFEKAAFDLKKDGDYTKPLATNIGYHIIKRISKRDNQDIPRLKKRIQARINKNDRFEIAEIKMIEDVKKEAGYKEDRLSLKRFATALDETFYSYKWQAPEYENTVGLIELAGEKYNLSDFAEFIKSNVRERLKFNKTKNLEEATEELFEKFVKEKVMAYEEANLERKHDDFRSLMREYREGILLFEITKQEVWDKASKDTLGLNKFFKTHSENYKWPERVKINKYTVLSDKIGASSAYTYYQKKGAKKIIDKYSKDKDIDVSVEEMIVDIDSELISGMELEEGKVSKLTLTPKPATFYAFVARVEPSPKTMDEAKGYVIADYQDYLEKEWISELQKKYPVKVNKKVLKSLTK
jgi:peptidyl-prolyl cis-trans isomerase SurA